MILKSKFLIRTLQVADVCKQTFFEENFKLHFYNVALDMYVQDKKYKKRTILKKKIFDSLNIL